MDTWATSSLTPQIVGGWETRPGPVRPGVPDGPAAAGAGDHPHLAVLLGGPRPLRARPAALARRGAVRLDPRPGPQEDVEVQGQRRHADGPAACRTAPTRCATGRPAAAPAPTWPSTRRRSRSAGGWRRNCSTRRSSRSAWARPTRCGSRSPSRWTGRCWPGWRPWSTTATAAFERVRPHRRAAGHRGVLLDVLRRLHRAGQGAGVRRPAGGRLGPGRAGRRRCRCCCGCSRRSCRT